MADKNMYDDKHIRVKLIKQEMVHDNETEN